MNEPDTANPRHLQPSDLRGASRLAVQATLGLTSLVENLHHNILRTPLPLGTPTQQPAGGITGLVYRTIRGVTRLVGGSLDALLGQLLPLLGPDGATPSPEREAVLAALNGVLGDHLAVSGNPLATTMHLRHAGRPLDLVPAALAAAVPDARPRVLLLIHGLCMNAAQWRRNGHDHGEMLATAGGFTPLYLQYNSGLNVAANGRLLADQLQRLADAWPVPLEELVIVGHSMGGLVARSAVAQASARGDAWPRRLRQLVFLGTPHHGAPLERGGHWIDTVLAASPYTAAFARLGQVRSAGITDLRHGCLLDADGAGRDRFAHGRDTRVPVPLPDGVACYAIAGTLASPMGRHLMGDGLVPLDSALGRHRQARRRLAFEPGHTRVVEGVGHLSLLDDAEVAMQLRRWLCAP